MLKHFVDTLLAYFTKNRTYQCLYKPRAVYKYLPFGYDEFPSCEESFMLLLCPTEKMLPDKNRVRAADAGVGPAGFAHCDVRPRRRYKPFVLTKGGGPVGFKKL
jgi:hypothetical protein